MTTSWKYLLGILVLMTVTIWLAFWHLPEAKLQITACDVGQGDAILATYQSTQILVDGGPGISVLSCLSEHMPFWDRELEIVVLTHPQEDHFGGLIEVFKNYKVDNFLANSLDSSSLEFQVLKNLVGGSGARVINPTTGMVLRLGKIYLDIVAPTKEFITTNSEEVSGISGSPVLGATISDREVNDFSIVAILRLGEFDALLTGDIGQEISDTIVSIFYPRRQDGMQGRIEYIKIPHHGSKNGLTENLLRIVNPQVAVISVGKNSYGHPHQETLEMLEKYGVKILRTDQFGDVEVVSDGESYWITEE